MPTTLARTIVARFDDEHVLISQWSDGRVEVARRHADGGTWGPPAEAVEIEDELERAAAHYEAQVAGIRGDSDRDVAEAEKARAEGEAAAEAEDAFFV